MKTVSSSIAVLFFSYLLGAVPFGYIIARFKTGRDIRAMGSGNIGATNVSRSVGKWWGRLVLILDILKGFIPPVVAFVFTRDERVVVLSGFLSVIGHMFPIYIGFKGGKGVASGLGALLGISIVYHIVALGLLFFILTWFFVHRIFGYVSLASISGALAFGIFGVLLFPDIWLKIFALLLSIFVVWRHKSNIVKLIKGKEVRSGL